LQGGSPWPPGVIPRDRLDSVRGHYLAQILMIVLYEKSFSLGLHLVMVLLEEEGLYCWRESLVLHLSERVFMLVATSFYMFQVSMSSPGCRFVVV
jgi:hypothetical protein